MEVVQDVTEKDLATELGLSQDSCEKIRKELGREPTLTELGMFGVMYSEHCSYGSSKPILKHFPTDGKNIMVRAGEGDAGVVDIGEGLALVFKIESHNHPSAVEPFQGAATGVGGIIRDIFTMGARPVALLNSLRFGNLKRPVTQRLLKGVVSGIGFYGNVMGIPTVGGEVVFDDTYEGTPLVNAMCVGLMRKNSLTHARAKGADNPVFYVGSTTGRDGLGGAAFASRDLAGSSEADRPAVQAGDPFLEKLLLEACLELIQAGVVVSMKDMGAAGLVCSTSESAASGGVGMDIDLSKVPLRAQDMTAYEILLSESQERMLIVVQKGREAEARSIFDKWDLAAVSIGRVTRGDRLTIRQNGQVMADVPAKLLTSGAPVYTRDQKEMPLSTLSRAETRALAKGQDWGEVFDVLLDSPSIASKRWVWEQYDHMVQTNTLVRPGADAAVLRIKGSQRAIAMVCDGNGRYAALDPFQGGMLAVAEAARNLVASGARPLAITNCLNFGNPQKPEVFWQFRRCVEGMSQACNAFQTPVTGGNVSFYNENPQGAIDPTPVVGMVGMIDDYHKFLTPGFKAHGDSILLIGPVRDEIGASEYLLRIHGKKIGPVPHVSLDEEQALQRLMLKVADQGILHSAHDVSDGGLAVAVAECVLSSPKRIGAKIQTESWGGGIGLDALLFGEGATRMVVSTAFENEEIVLREAGEQGLAAVRIGICGGSKLIFEGTFSRTFEEMSRKYEGALVRRLV